MCNSKAAAGAVSTTPLSPEAEPLYTMSDRLVDGKKVAKRIMFSLPLLESAKSVDLALSKHEVRLSADGYLPASIVLDEKFGVERAVAKFLRKSKRLRLDIPLAHATAATSTAEEQEQEAAPIEQQPLVPTPNSADSAATTSAAMRSSAMGGGVAPGAWARVSDIWCHECPRPITMSGGEDHATAATKAAEESGVLADEATLTPAPARFFKNHHEMMAAEAEEMAKLANAAEKLKTAGNQAFKAATYATALEKYTAALRELCPTDLPGNDSSEDEEESASSLLPISLRGLGTVLHSNCAAALLQLHRYEEALAAANRALALDAGHEKSQQRCKRAEKAIVQQKKKARREEAARKRQAKEQARAKEQAAAAEAAAAEAEEDEVEEFFTPGYVQSWMQANPSLAVHCVA